LVFLHWSQLLVDPESGFGNDLNNVPQVLRKLYHR